MHIELRHLQLVQAVAEQKSLTNAALQLHLTQSALSHQLRDLESRLGVRLFERRARGMSLTPAGEQLRAAAALVLTQLRDLETSVLTAGRQEPVRLRLATECYTCYHWLTDVIRALRAAFPHVDLTMEGGPTAQLLTAMVEGHIDVAVMSSDVSDARLSAFPLFSDELLVVVDASHRWAGRKQVELPELRSETIFMYGPKEHSRTLNESLIPAGVSTSQVKALQLTEAIIAMVRAGLGVSILARWAVQPYIDRHELCGLSIGPKPLRRTWKAVVPKALADEAHIMEFVNLARQLAFAPHRDERRIVRFPRSRK